MLVLSRKLNEEIVIDGKIVVKVVEIRGDRVRLGIEAPPATTIHRSEVHDAIHASSHEDLGVTRGHSVSERNSVSERHSVEAPRTDRPAH
ncbi:MAG: carbon storage regulator CsrA [Planctomycetota bacterium]